MGLATGVMLTAAVLATNLSFWQTNNTNSWEKKKASIGQTDNNTIKKWDDTTINIDSLNHKEIISMHVDSIISFYWVEKWLEIINEHMLIEVNKLRKEFTDSVLLQNENANRTLEPLTLNKKLCTSAQTYAEHMDKNNRFHHTGKDWSSFESRIRRTWYPFKFLWENLYKEWFSIKDVICEWKKSKTHYNVIKNKHYIHAWFWYKNGYWVAHFWWTY